MISRTPRDTSSRVSASKRGGKRQVQVLVDPDKMRQMGTTLHQVERALEEANENATGGYLQLGPQRLLVRSLGRINEPADLESLVIDGQRTPPLLLREVATIGDGPEIPIGRAAVNDREAVMLTIVKQPGADTRALTREVLAALAELKTALPADVKINPHVYRMDRFIDRAIDNVIEALRDGGILVVIVLVIFLFNFRTTVITLTAIPLSIFVTVLVFTFFDMSINTMTLGGLAVAIGELVDDAIVDVENIHRRLRLNRLQENPQPAWWVVFKASVEVRNSIVFGTMIVVLVFIPLFFLSGMEGRLFTPLGVAYIVSLLASLLVSLTVTPVLSYWFLGRRWVWPLVVALGTPALCIAGAVWLLPEASWWLQLIAAGLATPLLYGAVIAVELLGRGEGESFVLRGMKWLAGGVIRFSLYNSAAVLLSVGLLAALGVLIVVSMGRGFLPDFNEGSAQVSIYLPPGTSLEESNRVGGQVDRALLALDFVDQVGRRTGRAEEDEHVAGVNYSELIVELDPESPVTRDEQLKQIRAALDSVPGAESSSGRATTEQPVMHLMSHMLSGVKAEIAIKIYGDDLATLRKLAQEARQAIDGTPGIDELAVEQQVLVPQLQIKLDRNKLAQRGLTPGEVNHVVETAMKGRIVSRVLEGEASFDLIVRFDDPYRENLSALSSLALELPSGGSVPLADVADISPFRAGPNVVNRENGRRRIVIQCNSSGRPTSEVRDEIQQRLAPLSQRLPEYGNGYYIEYGGQFESEQAATRLILLLSLVSLVGIFLVLGRTACSPCRDRRCDPGGSSCRPDARGSSPRSRSGRRTPSCRGAGHCCRVRCASFPDLSCETSLIPRPCRRGFRCTPDGVPTSDGSSCVASS